MRKYFPFLFILCVLFVSCAGVPRAQLSPEEEALLYPVASYVPESFLWEEVCPGVARYDFENSEVPVIYHAVKIDLEMVGAGADCEDSRLKLVCSRGEKVSDFALREECIVSMNATPFGKNGGLVGMHREAGCDLSELVARYAAIGFKFSEEGDNQWCEARIFASQESQGLSDYPYAFGGFFTVLESGEVRQDFVRRHTARSGAGLTADGKTLYLLVVEGERPGRSRGLSYPQCGEIFCAMGCSDALEFDGGGSSDLCINKKSVLSYKVRRVVGNCFGFKN